MVGVLGERALETLRMMRFCIVIIEALAPSGLGSVGSVSRRDSETHRSDNWMARLVSHLLGPLDCRCLDCSAEGGVGQTNIRKENMSNSGHATHAPVWQALRITGWLLAVACAGFTTHAHGQLYDALDTHPPRWSLSRSDCQARVTQQRNLVEGGVEGGACESINFVAGNGSEAQFIYPIEPVLPLDDLTATVKVMSAKPGASIGFRVRYPYLRDPTTKKSVAVTVYGASYQSPGEFASLGIGLIEKPLRLKHVALRSEYGLQVDLSDPYVDAIVVNAYSGPGPTAIRIDELRVEGMIPVGDPVLSGNSLSNLGSRGGMKDESVEGISSGSSNGRNTPTSEAGEVFAFPSGTVTRVLQHNGEPLAWVRSLGFDGILTNQFPDSELLREAIQNRMLIYTAPPATLDAQIESLLEPIAGWYLVTSQVLDDSMLDQTEATIRKLRSLPVRWQRPILGSPQESWRAYASLLDGVLQDMPPRERALNAYDEIDAVSKVGGQLGDRVEHALAVLSMPGEALLRQNDAIADAISIPRPQSFHWHSMWLQVMRSLESAPSAIIFRSTRSLASGQPMDVQRSMSLSYINRMIAMIAPWISTATTASPPTLQNGSYLCSRLSNDGSDLLILTSTASRGTEVLAGDGGAIELQLTPADAAKTFWRLTHFSAERLTPMMTSTGPKLEIVSPDLVEVLICSSNPEVGGQAAASAGRFSRQATLDRWQLVNDALVRSQSSWVAASSMNRVPEQKISNLVEVAKRTMLEAEPMFRSGDMGSSIRMARRADAWILRSDWQLSELLMPDWPNPTSSPPVVLGAGELQVFWRPLMGDQGWGRNRLTTGTMDELEFFGDGRWSVGKRLTDRAESKVERTSLGTVSGPGALRASVVSLRDDPLLGGYEGTVLQIKSPSVRVKAGTAVRIDAWVKTIGFGGAHQGVLVYDTICGQELGVLLKNRPAWTPVRLYRQAERDCEIQVMFELLGAGEVTIDEVELRVWEPNDDPVLPMRSLDR